MRRREPAGFTLLEVVVVVALVAVLASVALDRLLRYQELAEKTAMEQVVGSVRSALNLQVSARIVRGGLGALAPLAEENPMDWLSAVPANYAGALFDAGDAQVPKGSWYYDRRTRELVYRPNLTRYLSPGPDGERIRFEVVVRVEAKGKSGFPELAELGVRSTRPYQWAPEF